MHVEVVYALAEVQHVVHLELPRGATVADALEAVRRVAPFDSLDLDRSSVGIYGRIASPGTELRPDDRVEIYRRLTRDPREARKRRGR